MIELDTPPGEFLARRVLEKDGCPLIKVPASERSTGEDDQKRFHTHTELGELNLSTIANYLEGVTSLIAAIPESDVMELSDALERVWMHSGKVLLMGNGGSAATASHFANDFQKCIQLESGRALRAICLADCGPLVLAWANDTEYANIFAPQVEAWAERGDLVIGISGSGNSPNVLNGIDTANRLGVDTFGLAGFGGGELAKSARKCVVVNSDNMQQVEDLHTIILHAAFTRLRERVSK